jgi:hypothetical protein
MLGGLFMVTMGYTDLYVNKGSVDLLGGFESIIPVSGKYVGLGMTH